MVDPDDLAIIEAHAEQGRKYFDGAACECNRCKQYRFHTQGPEKKKNDVKVYVPAPAVNSKSVEAMKQELIDLMGIQPESSWGPQPVMCRWCGCWLRYGDSSSGTPKEGHSKKCFAAKHLGRPVKETGEDT